jgi:FkbM family methyltransferase
MLEGIPKKEYPRLLYRYLKEFLEVLIRKNSFKVYLARNFQSIYKPNFRKGDKLKWKGIEVVFPQFIAPPVYGHTVLALVGEYSIPECNIEKDDTVFDVGAHFGFFSYYAVQKGAKEVYAFEPNPSTFEILKKHAKIWSDKIKPLEFALYSSSGFLDLFIPTPLSISSTLREKENCEKVKVKTITLDSFVKGYNVERVDFIKIDAEGSEREILKGAKETIKKFKPKMAIAAYHLPDDKKVIPELVLSIRDDYKFKLVDKGEPVLFFF